MWQYSDYDWEDDYTQQEELLLEMCGCYGVSEEDVLLLLDYVTLPMRLKRCCTIRLFFMIRFVQSSVKKAIQ